MVKLWLLVALGVVVGFSVVFLVAFLAGCLMAGKKPGPGFPVMPPKAPDSE
jgi:hypothetical protein